MNKRNWGIVALIIFVIAAGGFIYWQVSSVQQFKEQIGQNDAEELLRQSEKLKKVSKTDNKAEQAREGTAAESNTLTAEELLKRTAEKLLKHQEGETILTSEDIFNLTPEQQQAIFDLFYTQQGLDPPPKGYEYVWDDINVPALDENGKPILHKIGEPYIDIIQQVAFTPTVEEYIILKALEEEIGWQKLIGNTAKAKELQSEYDQLYQDVQRERPVIEGWSWVVDASEQEANPDKPQNMAREQLAEELKAQGLEYLIEILKSEYMW